MTDHNTMPGADAAMGGFATASKSMQTFAAELARMSKESMDQTTQLIEKLRGAKTLEDVVSIQTNFMQQSFSNYADYTRRFGELLTMLPLEMAKQGRTAMQQAGDAAVKATEHAGQQVQHATEQAAHQVQHATEQFQQNTQNYNNNQNHDHNQNYDNNQNYNNNQNYGGNQNY